MCSLMILQNKSIEDLLFVAKESENTIFHRVCAMGNLKLLLFLESMMPQKQFVDQLFVSNKSDIKPIEYAVRYSRSSIVKHLFEKKEIQERYKGNDQFIFRLCFHLFVVNSSEYITDFVLSALAIKREKVIEMLSYNCPRQPGYTSNAE